MIAPNLSDDMLLAFTIGANGNLFWGRTQKGLQSIYKTLSCNGIEGIRLQDAIMYIDDEGKFKDKPKMNKLATLLAWLNGLSTDDWIAGDAIIFGTVSPTGEMDGEDYDCPQYMFELFQKFMNLEDDQIDSMMSGFKWAAKRA